MVYILVVLWQSQELPKFAALHTSKSLHVDVASWWSGFVIVLLLEKDHFNKGNSDILTKTKILRGILNLLI